MNIFLNSPFFAPLKARKREWIIWGSVAVLLILKIYQGDRTFFEHHFAYAFEDEQIFRWAKWLYHHLATLILFCLVPLALIRFTLKEKVSNFGWQLGDWKFGLKATGISLLVMPFLVYNSSLNEVHHAFYSSQFPLTLATSSVGMFLLWTASYLPHYIGWEFFFRGYVQFGFKKQYGAMMAILLQCILTGLMHIGKPAGETWGALIGGIYFGLLTYRTNSVVWAILFHLYLGLLNTYFCS